MGFLEVKPLIHSHHDKPYIQPYIGQRQGEIDMILDRSNFMIISSHSIRLESDYITSDEIYAE